MSDTTDSAPPRIRPATDEDLELIVGFNRQLALETESIRLDDDTLREGVRAVLRDPSKGRYWMAERGGEVAGQLMTTFEWSDWRNGLFLWIQSVWVEPGHRRRGVFRALYRHVLEESRRPGMCGVRLYVHGGNDRAAETYRRLGMVSHGYSVLETPDLLERSDSAG